MPPHEPADAAPAPSSHGRRRSRSPRRPGTYRPPTVPVRPFVPRFGADSARSWSDAVQALYFTHLLAEVHPDGLLRALHLVHDMHLGPGYTEIHTEILNAALCALRPEMIAEVALRGVGYPFMPRFGADWTEYWDNAVRALYYTRMLLGLHPDGLLRASHMVIQMRPPQHRLYTLILSGALERHGF